MMVVAKTEGDSRTFKEARMDFGVPLEAEVREGRRQGKCLIWGALSGCVSEWGSII